MDKALQLATQLVGANPLADGSMSLRFYTQELTAKEKLVVLEYFQKAGWLLFKEDKFSEQEIPEDPSGYEEGKTPSQRLRGVIFRLWEQKGQDGDYESFYRKNIEKIIEQYKNKLNE